MTKRKRFYLSAEIWSKSISSAAFHVYGFLSWCADKSGRCYPSVAEISRRCHIAENTVRKAIRELERNELIRSQTQYTVTKSGKRRQTSNSYSLKGQDLNPPASNVEPTPRNALKGAGADVEGEINNKDIDIRKSDLSVSPYEENGLSDILDRLELYCYDDKHFTKAVELAVREMYHADHITVSGENIPKEQVRERLFHLTPDGIDHIYGRMRDYGANFQNAGKYLISCLYNAPMDFNTDIAAFSAAL